MGGWLEKLRIRLTSASTEVGVEVGAELGNKKVRILERETSGPILNIVSLHIIVGNHKNNHI